MSRTAPLTATATLAIAGAIIWAGWHREGQTFSISASEMGRIGRIMPTTAGLWLNSNGATLETTLDLELGRALVVVSAHGTAAFGQWPWLVLTVNGRDVADWRVTSTEARLYQALVFTLPGSNHVELRYVNDYDDPESGQDRNLYIESCRIIQGHAASALHRLAPYEFERALTALPAATAHASGPAGHS